MIKKAKGKGLLLIEGQGPLNKKASSIIKNPFYLKLFLKKMAKQSYFLLRAKFFKKKRVKFQGFLREFIKNLSKVVLISR